MNAHALTSLLHTTILIYDSLLSYYLILEILGMMDHHTLEDTNKVVKTEKESTNGHLEAERLQTGLMAREKEQPSTMIKMERKKTDFTRMVI